MPSRNIIRFDSPDSYYHVYARGAGKENIFRESADKDYFCYLISRHLGKEQIINKMGYVYPQYREQIELCSYCLMDNHFHLLVYQIERGTLQLLMKSIMTAYSMYFNRKYSRTGPLFENRYKASRITNDTYLLHISRYIHLNPRSWRNFTYSSYKSIIKGNEPDWLQADRIRKLFTPWNPEEYTAFTADYEAAKDELSRLKYELANF